MPSLKKRRGPAKYPEGRNKYVDFLQTRAPDAFLVYLKQLAARPELGGKQNNLFQIIFHSFLDMKPWEKGLAFRSPLSVATKGRPTGWKQINVQVTRELADRIRATYYGQQYADDYKLIEDTLEKLHERDEAGESISLPMDLPDIEELLTLDMQKEVQREYQGNEAVFELFDRYRRRKSVSEPTEESVGARFNCKSQAAFLYTAIYWWCKYILPPKTQA